MPLDVDLDDPSFASLPPTPVILAPLYYSAPSGFPETFNKTRLSLGVEPKKKNNSTLENGISKVIPTASVHLWTQSPTC